MTKADESKIEELTTGLQHREFDFQFRAEADTEKREIEGISVPYGKIAQIAPGITEEVRAGAVDDDGALIFYRHADPIGRLIHAEESKDGRKIRAKISKTTLGDDALTLARDGVLGNLSIGFRPVPGGFTREVREDGSIHIIHTKISVREISLVPLPAYEGAKVTQVREDTHQGGTPMATTAAPEAPAEGATDTPPAAGAGQDLELREIVADLTRRLDSGLAGLAGAKDEPKLDTRSAGRMLKMLADPATQAETQQYMNAILDDLQKRAYTGGTTADAIMKNSWVGDLTRLVEEAAPLLDLFARGDLPATGNVIEFGKLNTNTVVVNKQNAEGDDLTYGKVTVTTDTAPVETFGGYGELSFQTIERATYNLVDILLLAQAIAAGKAMNTKIRSVFNTVAAAQVTAGNTVAVPSAGSTYQDWIGAIVDAAIKFEALGLPITGMVTNAVVFKALGQMIAEDGRPVLLVKGDGNNNVGTFNPVGLAADLAGVTVRLDAGLAVVSGEDPLQTAAFVNRNAIRSYISPIARLQDQNIINLSKQFSVYRYAAFADEIPAAVVPVEFEEA